MDNPFASVVVPVLNGESTIGDLLTALINQRGADPDYEILVVDNGSTDKTIDIISLFDVVLLYAATKGPSAARNKGLYYASGEIVIYLDADTIPTNFWLSEILKPFTDPAVIIAAGRTYSYKPTTPAERFVSQMGPLQPEYDLGRREFPFMSSRNLAVRRTAALDIGGWTEDMPTAEDMDFCTRIRMNFDTEIHIQESAVVFHRDRADDDQLIKQSWSYGEGLADMYLRYPQIAAWDTIKTFRVKLALSKRAFLAFISQLLDRICLCSNSEYYRYLRLWSIWFWKGFFSMLRSGERHPL
jgi:glycosyltransferase involved in cell wall biosynthesis